MPLSTLLEFGEERWIVLYQSLATVHTNLFRSTELEASRLDGVHPSSGVGLFVKERIENGVVRGETRIIFSAVDGTDKRAVHIHAKTVDLMIGPIAPYGVRGIRGGVNERLPPRHPMQ